VSTHISTYNYVYYVVSEGLLGLTDMDRHGCKMTPSMDSWKAEAQYIKSRCGFCQTTFEKWQDRVDHLAKEFRNGADMKNWKGCRGLDAHVAIHVTDAMPPYLIANESKSPFPFSASNSSSVKVRFQNTDYHDPDWRHERVVLVRKDIYANEASKPICSSRAKTWSTFCRATARTVHRTTFALHTRTMQR
jgi:hypothetical protein